MFVPLHDRNPVVHIKFPYVNYALIAVTIAVLIYQWTMVSTRQADKMYTAFGMIPAVILNAAPAPAPLPFLPDEITLVTYAFMHAGLLHLVSNMLFLWIFGDNIEDALGHLRYLIFYLLCAALAAGAHLVFNSGSSSPLIGASGAVAGVMGAYALLYPQARVLVLARIVIPVPIPLPAIWMLGLWFVMQIFYAFISAEEPVAWWAHIGGMASGVALAVLMRRPGVRLLGGH